MNEKFSTQTYEESFIMAKQALTELRGIKSFGDTPRSFSGLKSLRYIFGDQPNVTVPYKRAMDTLESLPREHLIELVKRAVAERNSDALDQMSAQDQAVAVFNESALLSLLSSEETEIVLGISS